MWLILTFFQLCKTLFSPPPQTPSTNYWYNTFNSLTNTLAAPQRSNLHTVGEVGELPEDLLLDVLVPPHDLCLGQLGVNKLGLDDLLEGRLKGVLDDGPGDLGVGGGVCNGLLGRVVEGDDARHHSHGLNEGASVVVVCESVLLEEILADDLSNLHNDLLVLRETLLSNQLDNLGEVVLLLEDVTALVTEGSVAVVTLVEERLEDTHVLGVTNEPIE